jgi:hypothetical protein
VSSDSAEIFTFDNSCFIDNYFTHLNLKTMKEFLLLFRTDYDKVSKASPDQAEAMMKKWMDWLGGIAAQNKTYKQRKPAAIFGTDCEK